MNGMRDIMDRGAELFYDITTGAWVLGLCVAPNPEKNLKVR